MHKNQVPYAGKEFNRSTLYALSLFSNISYKNEEIVLDFIKEMGFSYLSPIICSKTQTQGYIAASDEDIVIFFRGTRDKEDMNTNLNILKVQAPSGTRGEEVHKGFLDAYESISGILLYEIKKLCAEKHRKIWLTGHSLGAAICGIAAYDFVKNKNIDVSGAYFFGQPRFCNKKFAKTYDALLKDVIFRIVNNNDIITRLPLRSMGYRHVGIFYYFNSKGVLTKGWTWVQRLKDSINGMLGDTLDGHIDAIDDHHMPVYCKLCVRNL